MDFIERLIELAGSSAIEELEVSQDGWRVRIVKAAARPAPAVASSRSVAAAGPVPLQAASVTPVVPAMGGHTITAPLIGTFFVAPSPGAPPFVSVGDIVAEGQTLGLIEAMKMLNAIEADEAGRIAAVLQDDGTPVTAGTALFTIEAAG